MTFLLFGFLIGMCHATEADHILSVAALTSKTHSIYSAVKQGAVWGLGHTLVLFVIGSVALLIDTLIPEHLAKLLEFLVGLMLLALGADVLRRLYKEHIHFHVHEHKDGVVHFHAHSHKDEEQYDSAGHDHSHPDAFPFRALFVGLMHGLAGSAALLLLTLDAAALTVKTAILYIALFGFGSIAGMAVLSFVIAVPLRYSADNFSRLHNSLQVIVGVATITIGSALIYETGTIQELLVF